MFALVDKGGSTFGSELFSIAMTTYDSATDQTEDRFYAQLDSREVELMTLDELQVAFEAGRIHENTFVCREGDSEWLTLAEVAGLGGDEPEAPPVVERRPPMPSHQPAVLETRPPMPARRPDMPSEARPPMPARRPDMLTEARPPMKTVPAARMQEQASSGGISSTSHSFAPVSTNIDYAALDLDDTALRPKRRWGLVLAAAAVLALAGGGTVFALNGGGGALASAIPDSAALQAAASRSQASLTPSSIETKPSEPAAAAAPAPVAATEEAHKATPQLSEDMKQALLAADKDRAVKHAAKANARVSYTAPHKGGAHSGGGLKTGGSAYDPLNGKL